MNRFFVVLLAVIIPLVSIISSFVLICRTPDYYAREFAKLKVADKIGIDEDDESEIAELLSDYINGKTDKLEFMAEIEGKEKNIFNEKEQLHMKDVKRLIGLLTGVLAVLYAVAFLIYYAFLSSKNHLLLRAAYKASAAVYVIFAVVMGIVALIDFEKAFDTFHKIFFKNNLWMLDPSKDVLVMLMPLQFFTDALITGMIISAVFMAAFGILTYKLTKEKRMFS